MGKQEGKLHSLAVGSRVFYPGQGVASVTGMEEAEFGGHKQAFYVLELDRGIKLRLPTSKVDQVGVRSLISAEEARDLLKTVKRDAPPAEVKMDAASRRSRASGYAEALRSGSAARYTEILCELLARARASKLSAGEQQSFNQAVALFVSEVSTVLEMRPDELAADLRPQERGA